jgi:hypothetical protein
MQPRFKPILKWRAKFGPGPYIVTKRVGLGSSVGCANADLSRNCTDGPLRMLPMGSKPADEQLSDRGKRFSADDGGILSAVSVLPLPEVDGGNLVSDGVLSSSVDTLLCVSP